MYRQLVKIISMLEVVFRVFPAGKPFPESICVNS